MKSLVKSFSRKYNQLMPGKEKLLIDLCLRQYAKTARRPINITSILHNCKYLIKQVNEKKCTQKCKKKMDQNI